MKFAKLLLTIVVILGLLLLAGCGEILDYLEWSCSRPPSEEGTLVGEWQMTRVSIKPAVNVPDMILSQIISDTATWRIAPAGEQLAIRYDGSDTWYKMLLFSVEKKPVAVAANTAKTACTFTSGGSSYLNKLPTIATIFIDRNIERISLNFDDKVQVNIVSEDKIAATITVNANGEYYSDTEVSAALVRKPIQQNATITYTGIRKK